MPQTVASFLSHQIQSLGPLRFDKFMDISLYQQDVGYYSSGKTRTGAQGDFLTPVSTGPVLGQLLSQQISEFAKFLNHPPSLHIVEQGADRGHLAHDILTSLLQDHPHLNSSLQLHLIEPSPPLAQQQKKLLQPLFSKIPIHWHSDISSLPTQSNPTFFYSCELIDSFPVRLIRFHSGQWHERFVTQTNSQLEWLNQPAPPELLQEISHWSIPAIEGFTAELRPSVCPWIKLLSEKIQQGIVLTLDYGLPAPELYHPSRSSGSLVALRHHSHSPSPLAHPGEQDLTAHVNFTQLIEEGNSLGFRSFGPRPFMSALTHQATSLLRQSSPKSEKWTRNFQHLVHPSFFGQSHLALLQAKNLPPTYRPSMFPI